MNISSSTYSISEILDMINRRDLVVNEEYQRAPRLWPAGPRSYFIDTILNEFPFPKLYFYEFLDRARKTKREIVDGQQRVMTIVDFVGDKFALSTASARFAGMRFSDLPDPTQVKFLGYPVLADVIRNAEKSDILQMFRRMNAYTLPLNEAEKRHSSYFGEFKGFINRLADKYAAFFSEWGVLTNRQIVRMADAELLTEMILAFEKGTVSSSSKQLSELYKTYDVTFEAREDYWNRVEGALDFIVENFGEMRNTYLMKPYVVLSLVSGLVYNRHGLPGLNEKLELEPLGTYVQSVQPALAGLKTLALAHESRDQGEFKLYVDACSAGSNREAPRTIRVKYIVRALRGLI